MTRPTISSSTSRKSVITNHEEDDKSLMAHLVDKNSRTIVKLIQLLEVRDQLIASGKADSVEKNLNRVLFQRINFLKKRMSRRLHKLSKWSDNNPLRKSKRIEAATTAITSFPHLPEFPSKPTARLQRPPLTAPTAPLQPTTAHAHAHVAVTTKDLSIPKTQNAFAASSTGCVSIPQYERLSQQHPSAFSTGSSTSTSTCAGGYAYGAYNGGVTFANGGMNTNNNKTNLNTSTNNNINNNNNIPAVNNFINFSSPPLSQPLSLPPTFSSSSSSGGGGVHQAEHLDIKKLLENQTLSHKNIFTQIREKLAMASTSSTSPPVPAPVPGHAAPPPGPNPSPGPNPNPYTVPRIPNSAGFTNTNKFSRF